MSRKSKDIFAAASRGSIKQVEWWLSQGVSINAVNSCPGANGHSVLHSACRRSQLDMMQFLLERGVDINAIDNNGETCLILCSRKAEVSLVSLLLSFGADTKIVTKDGFDAKSFTFPKLHPSKNFWERHAGVTPFKAKCLQRIATLLRRRPPVRPSPKYGHKVEAEEKRGEQRGGRERGRDRERGRGRERGRATTDSNLSQKSNDPFDFQSSSSLSPRSKRRDRSNTRSPARESVPPAPPPYPGRRKCESCAMKNSSHERKHWTPDTSPMFRAHNLSIEVENPNQEPREEEEEAEEEEEQKEKDEDNDESDKEEEQQEEGKKFDHLCAAPDFVVERAVQSMLNLGVEAATKHQELTSFLEELDLRQYLTILLDMGVKTVCDLRLVDRSDLEGRMKLIERRKFMRAASRLKTPVRRSNISTSTMTTESEEEDSMPVFFSSSSSSSSSSSFTSSTLHTRQTFAPGATHLATHFPKAASPLGAPIALIDKTRGAASAKVSSPAAALLQEEEVDYYPDGSFAVIVAINDYTSSVPLNEGGLPNLQCARNDGNLIKDTLVHRHGFEMLGELYDASATSMDLLDMLDTVKQKMEGKVKARFVFFLASHGYLDFDERGWICAHGCRLNKLNSTCLKMSVLKDFAESIDCMHQLYLLDCCHAGSLLVSTRGGPSNPSKTKRSEYEQAMLASPAIHGLTAVTKNQQALEVNGHGMFTRSFIEGLDGGVGVFAREERTHVTTTELFSYVQRRVLELAKQINRDQTPRCEPLLINHKKKPCDGQMLFFDWRERRSSLGDSSSRRRNSSSSSSSSGGRSSGGGGSSSSDETQFTTSHLSFNDDESKNGHKFNKTVEPEKAPKKKSLATSHMKFGHRRSRTYS